jgi:hypothetical protein
VALIKCPECSREISDRAEICPQCGYPVSVFLDNLKAEQLKAAELKIKAKRIEDEKLKLENIDDFKIKASLKKQIDTAPKQPKSNSYRKNKSNYNVMYLVLVIIIIVSACVTYINNQIESENIKIKADAKTAEINKIKNSYYTLKRKMNSNSVGANDLAISRSTLLSITPDMPEYKEAQALLTIIVSKKVKNDKMDGFKSSQKSLNDKKASLTINDLTKIIYNLSDVSKDMPEYSKAQKLLAIAGKKYQYLDKMAAKEGKDRRVEDYDGSSFEYQNKEHDDPKCEKSMRLVKNKFGNPDEVLQLTSNSISIIYRKKQLHFTFEVINDACNVTSSNF